MGEVADMMLDGTLCAGCGAYIGAGDRECPTYCSMDCLPESYKKMDNPEASIVAVKEGP